LKTGGGVIFALNILVESESTGGCTLRARSVETERGVAKGRIVVALVVFERTIAVGRDVFGAVRWLQKREAGKERNKKTKRVCSFSWADSASFGLHTAMTKYCPKMQPESLRQRILPSEKAKRP